MIAVARSMRRRHRWWPASVAGLLFVTACSGPVARLEVGMNTRSVDLLLGERVRVVTSAPLPPVLPPGFAPVILPDAGLSSLPPLFPPIDDSPPLGPCPAAAPDASTLNQVAHTATLPPAPKTYDYRTTGAVTAGKKVTKLPATTSRQITNIKPEVTNVKPETTRSYVFDIVTTVGKEKTTATFRIVPAWFPEKPPDTTTAEQLAEGQTGANVPDEDPAGGSFKPGLYLVKVDTAAEGFRLPDPGIKLVGFPVETGATFQTAGTDGVTTMSYTSTVSPERPRVDACGKLIDAYRVDLAGTMVQPTEHGTVDSTFTSSYAIATQFGGLIVQEKTKVTSGDVTRTIDAIINTVPAEPAEPGGKG